MRLHLVLLAIVTVVAVLTHIVLRRLKKRECFQDTTNNEVIAAEEAKAREEKIQAIIRPRVDDIFKIELPRSFVEWAVTGSSSATTADEIRNDLLANHDTRLQQFRTQDTGAVSRDAAWRANPKQETCSQATAARDAYFAALSRLRPLVQDLSGNLYTGITYKDTNRGYQQEPSIKDKCLRSQSPACGLATQDDSLVKAVAWYEGVNTTIFEKEIELTENINVLNQVLEVLNCPQVLNQPTLDPATGKTTDPKNLRTRLGYMDTPLLRMKLTEMSPYYLSPDVLQFLTRYLIDGEEVNSKVSTLTNLTQDISGAAVRLRALTR